MSDFIFNVPANQNSIITLHDSNGNGRLDRNEQVTINGHDYPTNSLQRLPQNHVDRQAWEALKNTLRISSFDSVTSLSAAVQVFQNRIQAANHPAAPHSFFQIGNPPDVLSQCRQSAALQQAANDLARQNGMGVTEVPVCGQLLDSARLYLGGSSSIGSGVEVRPDRPAGNVMIYPVLTLSIPMGGAPAPRR
ncbi:MAG: hypothetical protein U1F57_03930 [bacterium]